jgi:hypothetical protein
VLVFDTYFGAGWKDGLEGVEAVVELLSPLALGEHVLQLVHRRRRRRRLGGRRLLVVVLLLGAIPRRRVHLGQHRHGRLEHPLAARARLGRPLGAEVPRVALERTGVGGRRLRHHCRRRRRDVEVGVLLVVVGHRGWQRHLGGHLQVLAAGGSRRRSRRGEDVRRALGAAGERRGGQRERGGRRRGREAAGVARVEEATVDADRVVHADGRGNSAAAIVGRHVVGRRLVVHVHAHADLRVRDQ